MKRLLVLFVPAILTGCEQPADKTPQAPAPGISAEIDSANWPTATDKPVRTDGTLALLCDAPPTPAQIQARQAERKRHGPHYQPAIVVRVNPEAIAAFRVGRAPMPVGTIVVKEKHHDLMATGPPAEFGAMIKREPGFDPAHGDWEYLFVSTKPERKVTRGKLESCIDCHAHEKDKDYLFRTYLLGKSTPVSGW